MAADQQFCLRWNNHQSTLISVFDTLLENGTLVDCTLAAEGQYLKAHKVVLSACSPYMETLLSQNYDKHPILILKDVKFTELKSMMDYMYRGEVNISQDQLGTFLKAAESLQIKGLSENGEGDARDVGSTNANPPPPRRPPATRPEPEAAQSPAHRSRDGSVSPSSRKRRRLRRNSDDGDNHIESNSCDVPAQSTPVPNIPASITTTPIRTPIVKPEVNDRLDHNTLPAESGLLKEKIEPAEPLLEPKTEYLEDLNNDDSVEDLTLDDDDEMDMSQMSNLSNMSRPGPSHGADLSNQGFPPWQLGNQSGTDEVFMAAQEAVNAHRDSQGEGLFTFASCGSTEEIDPLLTSEEDAILPDQQSVSTDEGEELTKMPLPKTFKTPSSEISKSKIGPYPIWSPTSEISKTKKGPYPIWSPKSFVSLQNGKSSRNLCISAPKQFKSQGNANNIGKRPRGRPRINFQVSRNYPISSGGGKARRGRPRIHFSNPSSKTVRVEQSFNSNPLNISKSNIKEVSTAQSLNHTNSTSHLKNEKSFEKPKQRVGQKTESFGNFPSLFEVKERLKSLFSDETALDGATSKDIKNSSTNEEIKLNQSLEKTKLLKSDVKSPFRKSSPEEITFVSCSSSSSTYVRGTVSRNQITPKKDNSELRALLAMGSKVDTPESQAKGTTVEKIPIKKSIAQETEKSPEKRSVGRPRKDNSPVKSLEKKPVGRPRKDNSPAKSPSGRPRGRPKKSEVEIETSPSPTVTQNKVKNKTVVEKIITEPTNIETSEKSKKTPEFSSGVCLKTPNYIPTGRPRGRPRKQAVGRPRKETSEVDSSSGASATTHNTESC